MKSILKKNAEKDRQLVVKKHLRPDEPGYFLPTPEWDQKRSHNRLWS